MQYYNINTLASGISEGGTGDLNGKAEDSLNAISGSHSEWVKELAPKVAAYWCTVGNNSDTGLCLSLADYTNKCSTAANFLSNLSFCRNNRSEKPDMYDNGLIAYCNTTDGQNNASRCSCENQSRTVDGVPWCTLDGNKTKPGCDYINYVWDIIESVDDPVTKENFLSKKHCFAKTCYDNSSWTRENKEICTGDITICNSVINLSNSTGDGDIDIVQNCGKDNSSSTFTGDDSDDSDEGLSSGDWIGIIVCIIVCIGCIVIMSGGKKNKKKV